MITYSQSHIDEAELLFIVQHQDVRPQVMVHNTRSMKRGDQITELAENGQQQPVIQAAFIKQ